VPAAGETPRVLVTRPVMPDNYSAGGREHGSSVDSNRRAGPLPDWQSITANDSGLITPIRNQSLQLAKH